MRAAYTNFYGEHGVLPKQVSRRGSLSISIALEFEVLNRVVLFLRFRRLPKSIEEKRNCF